MLKLVELRQQLTDHAIRGDRALFRSPNRCDGLELIEENQRGRHPARQLEDVADRFFGVAEPLRKDLRTADDDERRLQLRRERVHQQRFARTRRPVEQNAAGEVSVFAVERESHRRDLPQPFRLRLEADDLARRRSARRDQVVPAAIPWRCIRSGSSATSD